MKLLTISLCGLALFINLQAVAAKEQSAYTVPVPAELTPFATFEIPEAKLRIRHGKAKMEYILPSALTGKDEVKVEASGNVTNPNESFHLEGYLGDMDCTVESGVGNCHINYNPLTLPVLSPEGKEQVAAHLTSTIADPQELSNRLKVLDIFYHEAAGDCKQVTVR